MTSENSASSTRRWNSSFAERRSPMLSSELFSKPKRKFVQPVGLGVCPEHVVLDHRFFELSKYSWSACVNCGIARRPHVAGELRPVVATPSGCCCGRVVACGVYLCRPWRGALDQWHANRMPVIGILPRSARSALPLRVQSAVARRAVGRPHQTQSGCAATTCRAANAATQGSGHPGPCERPGCSLAPSKMRPAAASHQAAYRTPTSATRTALAAHRMKNGSLRGLFGACSSRGIVLSFTAVDTGCGPPPRRSAGRALVSRLTRTPRRTSTRLIRRGPGRPPKANRQRQGTTRRSR